MDTLSTGLTPKSRMRLIHFCNRYLRTPEGTPLDERMRVVTAHADAMIADYRFGLNCAFFEIPADRTYSGKPEIATFTSDDLTWSAPDAEAEAEAIVPLEQIAPYMVIHTRVDEDGKKVYRDYRIPMGGAFGNGGYVREVTRGDQIFWRNGSAVEATPENFLEVMKKFHGITG